MATEIKIPKLGLTMKEAKLVKWLIDAARDAEGWALYLPKV